MEEINDHSVVTDPNCINCLVCVSTCPQDAIDFTVNKKEKVFLEIIKI